MAASWISGWRAVEPDSVMLPVTQLTVAAALGAVVAAMLVAVVGAGGFVGAGLGVALDRARGQHQGGRDGQCAHATHSVHQLNVSSSSWAYR